MRGARPSPRKTSALVVGLRAQLSTIPMVFATRRQRCAEVASAPMARIQTGTPFLSRMVEVRSCSMPTAAIRTPLSNRARRFSGPYAAQLKKMPAIRPRSSGPDSTFVIRSHSRGKAGCTVTCPPRSTRAAPSRTASATLNEAEAFIKAPAAASRTA
eukprot:scaffold41911_cov31-Tisochrysis_lutea.AAC.6